MNKRLIIAMCGLLTIGSMSVGSFADSSATASATALEPAAATNVVEASPLTPATILENAETSNKEVETPIPATVLQSAITSEEDATVPVYALTDSFDLEDCDFDESYETTWDEFKAYLEPDTEISAEDNAKLESLFNEIVSEEEKLFESGEDLTDENFQALDAKWDEFYSTLDTYFEFNESVEATSISWTDLKESLDTDTLISNEDNSKLEVLYDEILTEEDKLYKTSKELTESDFIILDAKWDEFFNIVDKYCDLEEAEEASPITWTELKESLDTDTEISNEDDATLETLFNSITLEEDTLYNSEKELTDADFESVDKKWDELFTIVDRYYDEVDDDSNYDMKKE